MKVDLVKLRDYRKEKGISLTYMSKKLGYSYASGYANIEYGITNLSLEKAAIIAKVLNVDINELFFDEKLHEEGNFVELEPEVV